MAQNNTWEPPNDAIISTQLVLLIVFVCPIAVAMKKMAFHLEHVQQVRNGQPRQVGVLPDKVWRSLKWPCPWDYLGESGLHHFAMKHPYVSDCELLWLPLAIVSGIIVHITKNPRQILVAYHSEQGTFFRCALKSAQSGTEVWVDSFYRTSEAQFKNFDMIGTLLRPHKRRRAAIRRCGSCYQLARPARTSHTASAQVLRHGRQSITVSRSILIYYPLVLQKSRAGLRQGLDSI